MTLTTLQHLGQAFDAGDVDVNYRRTLRDRIRMSLGRCLRCTKPAHHCECSDFDWRDANAADVSVGAVRGLLGEQG